MVLTPDALRIETLLFLFAPGDGILRGLLVGAVASNCLIASGSCEIDNAIRFVVKISTVLINDLGRFPVGRILDYKIPFLSTQISKKKKPELQYQCTPSDIVRYGVHHLVMANRDRLP